MILKSRTRPINLSSSLRLCCMNILDGMSANTTQDHISEIHCENDVYSAEEENLTQKNVHWQNAKQLLLHGTSGQTCLDLADGCSELQHLLTTPCINEVSKVIPWTSHSKAFEKRLAEVARGRNCTAVEGTTYWIYDDDIARGAFGHVFAGINEKDGMEVAIKRIESLNMKRRQDKREIRTFTALTGCKQIVQYLGYFERKEFSYIVLELMEGTLDDYFQSTVYDSANTNVLSKDIAIGLKHLHDQNIIHRDLKPSNILYKTHPNLCLKIADFGLSRPMDLDFSESVMSKSVGTVGWIAPEVANGDSDHSKSSDIFCCGLVFHYFFSSQQHPFNPADCTGKNEIQLQAIRNSNLYVDKKMEGWNTSLSAEVSDLLKKMLEFDENRRPSALDMLEHPMFWSEKKKMDFLSAVGNQPEIEFPATSSSVSPINADLEAKFSTIIKHPKWDDSGYKHMPTIFAEMTRPIVKTFKKGKTRTVAARKYDTTSVIQLIRFIRNTISHVSQAGLPSQIRSLILTKCVFQKEFPRLVIEVYNAVVKHGWNTREEIKHAINN